MNRSGPELVGVDVFQHPELGRTIKVVIIARRNRTAQDLAFAFTSAAAVANLMEREIDLLWVEMNVEYNGTETSHALAPVKCSIDALVFDGCDVDEFWKNCVEFP